MGMLFVTTPFVLLCGFDFEFCVGVKGQIVKRMHIMLVIIVG